MLDMADAAGGWPAKAMKAGEPDLLHLPLEPDGELPEKGLSVAAWTAHASSMRHAVASPHDAGVADSARVAWRRRDPAGRRADGTHI